MDIDKQLRADLIKSALQKADDLGEVLPKAQEWLAFINHGTIMGQPKLPTREKTKPKSKFTATTPVSKTKPAKPNLLTETGRASIKNHRRGGYRYTDEDRATVSKLLQGKPINSATLRRVSEKVHRSVKALRLAIQKGTFEGIVYPGSPPPARESKVELSVKKVVAA